MGSLKSHGLKVRERVHWVHGAIIMPPSTRLVSHNQSGLRLVVRYVKEGSIHVAARWE